MALLPILAGIGAVGKLLSATSKGRADGRQAEIDVIGDRDRAALDRARLADDQAARRDDNAFRSANLDLDRREYGDKARTGGYKDRMFGGLLEGLQDFQVTPPAGVQVGQISGGLRPSAMIGKEALGSQMSREAIVRGLDGPRFAPVQTGAGAEIPGLSDLPQAGKLDKFLNIASLIANLAGTVPEFMGQGGQSAAASAPNPAAGNASRIINSGRVRF